MKRSWGFLIPKYYNYGFENFYATVIQRAYRNYKKRPESLAKRIWEAVRNDDTPVRWKYLGIIPRDMYYYYINGELIEFNWKVDHFYSRYSHILYSTRTWAEEKQNQLACRLNWLSFELVKKLLQQEGYVLLYGTFEWPIMIKWTQNPKYYLDTEENRNSRHFVRKDMLGPHDIKSIESHSRLTSDWWYKHKAWVDKFAISQFYKFRQNKNIV
ncbi:hypothetical protein GLOIN_2v1642872 [Rhizophagus clarus]|uniref:Uncharacterized protein n=1 Tax=Rhizophagus clarus TaxID=94130 RepID=A0A8H3QUV5_9GLOM|nr:hypothetical protein GLOIN_2v1642872 [Rhizophagus clarus]